MCAADKVFLNDTADGASLGALAAADALIVIDHRKIMLDLDCTVLTSLSAFSATDTSVGAGFSRDRSLVVIGAENCDS